MAITSRARVMKLAIASAIAGTPVGLLGHLAPAANPLAGMTETFGGKLADGSTILASRRDGDENTVHVFAERDGNVAPLSDGRYELDDGYGFSISNGKLDYDALIALDGYTAWREVVGIPAEYYRVLPPFFFTSPIVVQTKVASAGAVLDYVVYKAEGVAYYVVQRADRENYEVYRVEGDQVVAVTDGTYPLPHSDARMSVREGRVTSETVPHLLAALGADPV